MKTKFCRSLMALALLALATLNPQLSTAFAQGSLTPPGVPGPTMLTLNQMEPRTPISSAPYTISQPGSYYLTANLTVASGDAIDINANGVTLDLNGFTISSTDPGNTGTGIAINGAGLVDGFPAASDITIFNGHITGSVTYNGGTGTFAGPGFLNGISVAEAIMVSNVRVSGVSVSGCLNNGINLSTPGTATVVDSCTVNNAGGFGIVASTVTRSTAYQCGNTAIYTLIASDCYGYSLASVGVLAYETAHNCTGITYGEDSDAVYAYNANNCYGYCANGGTGVDAQTANNCYGTSNYGIGLYAYGAINCYGYGQTSGNGLDASSANNCYGSSSTGTGLSAVTANNCDGFSTGGDGLDANNANNCYGYSLTSGNGISVPGGIAIGSIGYSGSGTGLVAAIANSCISSSGDASISYKYNMP